MAKEEFKIVTTDGRVNKYLQQIYGSLKIEFSVNDEYELVISSKDYEGDDFYVYRDKKTASTICFGTNINKSIKKGLDSFVYLQIFNEENRMDEAIEEIKSTIKIYKVDLEKILEEVKV